MFLHMIEHGALKCGVVASEFDLGIMRCVHCSMRMMNELIGALHHNVCVWTKVNIAIPRCGYQRVICHGRVITHICGNDILGQNKCS